MKTHYKIYKKAVSGNEKLKQQAQNNSQAMFENNMFPEEFQKIAQELFRNQANAFAKLFKDKEFYTVVMKTVGKGAYKELRK